MKTDTEAKDNFFQSRRKLVGVHDKFFEHQQPPAPKTPNEAAAQLYPKLADNFTAFVEHTAGIGDFPRINLFDLHDSFWANTLGLLGNQTNPFCFVQQENKFRRYNPSTGVYEPSTEAAVVGALNSNLDSCAALFSQRVRMDSFVALKNRMKLKGVVERAKDLLCVSEDFFKPKPHHLPVNNGVLDLVTNKLLSFSPALPLKQKLPVGFSPDATCEVFLKSFLAPVVKHDDIDLLQRYFSQLLEGRNHTQTILLLNGQSGWGKSSLMKIIGSIFGWDQAGIIREQVFKSDEELSYYRGRRFLYHPDMPTSFFDRNEASLFKQLVGGDPLWAENQDGDMITIEGNFPCILASNGNPRIKIDCDSDAWLRRLVVVPFNQAFHEQKMGKLAELIVRTEASGILNWLLEGRRKLMKANLQLFKTEEQQRRTVALVMASQSPKAFVKSCLVREEGAEMVGAVLYAHYQTWCLLNQVTPFAGQYFNQMAKDEIEITLGLRYRHDLKTEDGTMVRGWKNLAVVQNAGIESKVSGKPTE